VLAYVIRRLLWAVLLVVAMTFVTFVIDLLYPLVDPRIRGA
jgi:ABC-type dipeptide/oligopeptide/nickel transport system permease component